MTNNVKAPNDPLPRPVLRERAGVRTVFHSPQSAKSTGAPSLQGWGRDCLSSIRRNSFLIRLPPPKILLILSLLLSIAAKEKTPAPPPTTYTTPTAATPAKTTRITFHGAVTGKPLHVWTSFPANITKASDTSPTFDLTPDKEVPVGIHALRLATTKGLSNLQLFMIDDLPTIASAAKNNSPQSAQPLALPTAVDGATQQLTSDYYTFEVSQNQTLSFDIIAQRLGSHLDPVVRILDSAGHEVAYCDDTPGLGADIRFSHTFASPGKYTLELRDTDYQGGGDHFYHVRIGHFPTATVAFPLAGKGGAKTDFTFSAPPLTGEGGQFFKGLTIPVTDLAPRQFVPLRYKDDNCCGFVTILSTKAADFIPKEPNLIPTAAARINLPAAICARFENREDTHYYQFSAQKDQHLKIRAQTRSLNSPCDLVIECFDPNHKSIAQSKPAAADEGTLEVIIPADGQYQLAARDLAGLSGPAAAYRLIVEPILPGFALSVDTGTVNARPGSEFQIKVTAARTNFEGPIVLSLTGDAKDFELKNQTIGKGKTETTLAVILPKSLPAGAAPLTFTIQGHATINNATKTQTATSTEFQKTLFPRLPAPPAEFDGIIGLGILP